MEYGIKGKTALITGSAESFGGTVARELAAEGANVILHDLDIPAKRAAAEQFCRELTEKYGVRATAFFADLSDENAVLDLFRRATEWADVDILVNNAAIWPTDYVVDMPISRFKKTIDINLTATFILCREMVNYAIANKKKAKIVNMVSQAAFNGSTTGHAHYAASKAGVVAFTVSLAREVSRYGININAVAPGMMRTEMNREALAEREDEYLKRIPIGRIAEQKDVADVVVFLCSDRAGYMTGATVDASGGMLMR